MIMSATDPEPASSSSSDRSENAKMVIPFYRFTIGSFGRDVSPLMSSRMSGPTSEWYGLGYYCQDHLG